MDINISLGLAALIATTLFGMAAVLVGLVQVAATHFWGKRQEKGAETVEHEREWRDVVRQFDDLCRENLRDHAHNLDVVQVTANDFRAQIAILENARERQHTENLAAIEREARAADRIAEHVDTRMDGTDGQLGALREDVQRLSREIEGLRNRLDDRR